ncbi:MAG: hypothetical protein HY744_13035 [Deltaproteobacteria bacterium]|nr:hypothetical protein [Deltaproteobacteria bacterium]
MRLSTVRLLSALVVVALSAIVYRQVIVPGPLLLWNSITEVIYGLALSYVPGFLVYVLTMVLPEVRQKQRLRPYLHRTVATVYGDAEHTLGELAKATKLEATRERVADILAAVSPRGASTDLQGIGTPAMATWIDFLRRRAEKTRHTIGEVFRFLPYLDAELVRLLVDIDHCFYVSHVTRPPIMPGNQNLSYLAKGYASYLEAAERLKAYVHKNFGETMTDHRP